MPKSEYDPLSLPFATKEAVAPENKLLVAVTVAAVVLAGSAIAYRHAATKPGFTKRLFWKDSHAFEEQLENEKNMEDSVDPDSMGLEYNASNNGGISKNPRSKDRRKRGKDPLREALKSGKKLKSFPIPAGSSSTPSSPKPPSATLSSSIVGNENRVGENADLSSGSSAALQTQLMDASQDSPTKRIQREKSPPTLATRTTHLSATGYSRDTSGVSHISPFTRDEEDDEDFPDTSSRKQDAPLHNQSPNSLSRSSLSLPRSISSLADVSEAEPEDGGWVTSVSKPRSKHRARLADVMFEDVLTGTGGHDRLENWARDEGVGKSNGKARSYTHNERKATEGTSVVEEISMFPPSNGARQGKGDHPQKLDPSHWDSTATAGQGTALSSGTLDMSSNEVLNADTDGEQEKDGNMKQPQFASEGGSGMSYASFSSAVNGGGRVVGQCHTASVTAAVASRTSVSGPKSDDVSKATPSSTGPEDGETEFTFPTLNSQAGTSSSGPSTRARSYLIGNSVNSSSPSKKNKRFSGNKSGTPPPNAPPSRTSSPSIPRENHTANYVQGPNAGSGSNSTPALSAQTQLASLRGALEAARQREEKHKTEMEKVMKELETLKWESTNSRRGETELQAQVRQLTHQLQSYAALFASVAPHLNSHFAMQLDPRTNDSHTHESSSSDINSSDPGTSPKVDPNVELPDGVADPSTSKTPELEKQVTEAQEEEAVSDKGQNHVPVKQPFELPSSPASNVNGLSSPILGAQHPLSPPPSGAIPAFFPYYQHPHFPVHHSPWMYHHYQPQRSTQNVSGTPGGPSSSPPPQHYTNIYSPMMYPISPVLPPLSPQSVGMMSPLFQYQSFGFGGGLRSAGPSSAGLPSPELTGRPKPRIRRRRSQMTNLNGNARTGWEDVGDGWVGLSRVDMQPTTTNVDKLADKGGMADGEVQDDDAEGASSPYSELLADAILKRSSTIRPPKKNSKRENSPSGSHKVLEEVEPFSEFTFPSLSDVYYRTASRTESSISSSLSSSPPSTTATVPDLIGEEDKTSLHPVVEKVEDSDPSVSDAVIQEARRDMPNIIQDQTTPKKEDRGQSSADTEQ